MAKCRRTEDVSLPEEIIQHIQSFMSGKEAAQTSILSKSWSTAWFTRPDLHFNSLDFCSDRQYRENEFWNSVRKIMKRYQESNLKIESFRLCMLISSSSARNRLNSQAKEFIMKAMKMGAVDFDFGVGFLRGVAESFVTLPRLLLESETLTRLSVTGIKMERGKISWLGLRSLSLDKVSLEDDIAIWDIISSCPMIEKLTLSKCMGNQGRLRLGVYNGNAPHKLKSLFLVEVDVDPLFFSEHLPNFPCLKNLSLNNCGGYNYEGIQLSSRSLECMTFKQERLFKANFDVPRIRKFEYSGTSWPSVKFTTASRLLGVSRHTRLPQRRIRYVWSA